MITFPGATGSSPQRICRRRWARARSPARLVVLPADRDAPELAKRVRARPSCRLVGVARSRLRSDGRWDGDLRELPPLIDVLLPNELELTSIARLAISKGASHPSQELHDRCRQDWRGRDCARERPRSAQVTPPPITGSTPPARAIRSMPAFSMPGSTAAPAGQPARRGGLRRSRRALGGTTAQPTGDELAIAGAAWRSSSADSIQRWTSSRRPTRSRLARAAPAHGADAPAGAARCARLCDARCPCDPRRPD